MNHRPVIICLANEPPPSLPGNTICDFCVDVKCFGCECVEWNYIGVNKKTLLYSGLRSVVQKRGGGGKGNVDMRGLILVFLRKYGVIIVEFGFDILSLIHASEEVRIIWEACNWGKSLFRDISISIYINLSV